MPRVLETLESIVAAKTMNWTRMWDPCYEKGRGGVFTEECRVNERKYGISEDRP